MAFVGLWLRVSTNLLYRGFSRPVAQDVNKPVVKWPLWTCGSPVVVATVSQGVDVVVELAGAAQHASPRPIGPLFQGGATLQVIRVLFVW